jgi:hypothetical protein
LWDSALTVKSNIPTVLVLVPEITPRLQYIFDFLGKEIMQQGLELTTNKQTFLEYSKSCINYSTERLRADELFIEAHPLLFQKTIILQEISCFDVNGYKAFFKTNGDYPFDIFAASFYLISRYEEYLPHKKDSYGRYAHENSLAFREGFLNLPLVNIWMQYFKEVLRQRFPALVFKSSSFLLLPTYDIDIAWSYKNKGWWRQLGGFARSLLKGEWKAVKDRIAVLRGKQKDPFDAYGWMNQLHEKKKLRPYYFFLLAEKNSRYDKNISPAKKAMKELISDHIIRYPTGIHPSWQSGDHERLLQKEIAQLAAINGNPIVSSRQHYIRFTLPETFRKLIANKIGFDFSMGYGSINGFRASATTPFYWYDLNAEAATNLLLFPFCFMEANSFYEQHYSPQQALEEMRHYYKEVKQVQGTFIMIWHNSFLGTDKLYEGWKEAYEAFMNEI